MDAGACVCHTHSDAPIGGSGGGARRPAVVELRAVNRRTPCDAVGGELVPRRSVDIEVIERLANAAPKRHELPTGWPLGRDPRREHTAWQPLKRHAIDVPYPAKLPTEDVVVDRVEFQFLGERAGRETVLP